MLKRYHHIIGGIFRVVDASVIGIAWIASYWLRFYVPLIEVTKGFPEFERYAALTPFLMLLWLMVFSGLKVYRSRRLLRRTDEAHLILKAHLVAIILFITLTYLFSEYKYSRGVILYFGLMGGVLLISFRLLLRNALRKLRAKGFNLRYVLVVGEGPMVEHMVARLNRFPELGLRVVGFVSHPRSTVQALGGPKRLGSYQDIPELLKKYSIDQLIIALSKKQYEDLDDVLARIKDETVSIRLIPDLHEYITLGCEVEEFDGIPIVNLNDSPLDGWGAIVKRVTDFILALLALILLSPVLLLIALAVKVSSPGPVLFKQERMGLDGKTFNMLKFRSMRADAEKDTGAVWAQPNDQRRTWLGSFLRSTSLDELPQFWNVLIGDMSLVGPRPERPVFVSKFKNEIPHYMLRHKVKAGITGWAQVNGWRGNTSLDRRIEFDLYYIQHWSYGLDWKILFMTLWKGFLNKNAY